MLVDREGVELLLVVLELSIGQGTILKLCFLLSVLMA